MRKYFKHRIENLIVVDKLVTVLNFEFDKNFKTNGEAHNFWEIVYVERSEVVCIGEEGATVLKEGEMLFHKPNEFHALSANGKNAPTVFIIAFECKSEAMKFFANKKIKLDDEYVKFVRRIISESQKTFLVPYSNPSTTKLELLENPTLGGMQLIKNYLEILLINIMRSQTETEKGNHVFLQKNELNNKLVNEVINILKNEIYNKISMEDICSEIYYSKTYIFKQFKKNTGYSIMEYYNKLKIEKAKQLLLETEMSIKEISEKLSFDTPNYFSKTFKRLCGVTPSAYKKYACPFIKI